MSRQPEYRVLGSPIAHSLSPGLHNRLLSEAGLPGRYVAVETRDAVSAANSMRVSGVAGASVTLPLKVDMLRAVDRIDSSAERVGAVNTLYWRDEQLVGGNTDVDGVRASIDRLGIAVEGRTVVVLGTGGAARVAAHVLLECRVGELLVASRSGKRAREFVLTIGSGRGIQWPDGFASGTVDLLVNATPVGMWPDVEATPVTGDALDRAGAVLDLVYNPDPTRLVREATGRGKPATGGTEMFAVQAARQFELWTEIAPELALVRRIVRELLMERTR